VYVNVGIPISFVTGQKSYRYKIEKPVQMTSMGTGWT